MKQSVLTKWIAGILATTLMTTLSGCGGTQAGNTKEAEKSDRLKVVTTIFPLYDWTKEVLGTHAEETDLTLLLKNGVDMHSFQPTAEDIMTIADSDLFIYVGGESDAWVTDVLQKASSDKTVTINLMEHLDKNLLEEELADGMETHDHDHDHEDHEEHDHDHDHEDNEDHDHDHEDHDHEDHEHEEHEAHDDEMEYDEHLWLSLSNAALSVEVIADALASIDPEHAEDYEKNMSAYCNALDAIGHNYEIALASCPKHTLLFGDRFPFLYLLRDYGLEYYAAFPGCSAETEASFETVTFLAQKTDDLGLKAIMTIEGSDTKIAQTIIQNTEKKNQTILTIDSMQAVTEQDIAAGATYLKIMEKNLEILKEALQ